MPSHTHTVYPHTFIFLSLSLSLFRFLHLYFMPRFHISTAILMKGKCVVAFCHFLFRCSIDEGKRCVAVLTFCLFLTGRVLQETFTKFTFPSFDVVVILIFHHLFSTVIFHPISKLLPLTFCLLLLSLGSIYIPAFPVSTAENVKEKKKGLSIFIYLSLFYLIFFCKPKVN